MEREQEIREAEERRMDELLEKIQRDRYPSSTMMDDVESLLTPWRRQDYADILLEKVSGDRFPSRSMIKRLIRLSDP